MYEYLKLLEKKNLLGVLITKGIVPLTLAGHKLIYEVYLKELKENIKSQAITNTSIETKTPERTIYRIIAQMESK